MSKTYCSYAALNGTVGAALNRLGMWLQNDNELLENSKYLPFFERHSDLHLGESEIGESLAYEDPYVNEFRLFELIYNTKRGTQPYSSKVLSELILDRRVELEEKRDDQGKVVSWTPVAVTDESWGRPLNESEVDFLSVATVRACGSLTRATCIPRIRFLNEVYLSKEGSHVAEEIEATELFKKEWKRCDILRKLKSYEFDYFCALLLPEIIPKLIDSNDGSMPLYWKQILDHFADFILANLSFKADKYTVKMVSYPYHYILAYYRMDRLRKHGMISKNLKYSNNWKDLPNHFKEMSISY